MIPLVLGIGATFIILMGSIDLSVEGVLTSAAVDPVDAGAERRQRQRPRPPRRRSSCCCVGAGIGFVNGVIHVQAAHPVLHGDARHLVHRRRRRQRAPRRHGDPHQRPDDPRPRDRSASSGFPWGVWLALACLLVASSSRTTPASAATSTRSAAARIWRRSPASPVARVRIAAFTLAGVFYARRRHPRRGPARPRQRADRHRAGCSPPSPPWSSAAPRCPAAQGGVLQTLVGVLIVVVLSNGMVLMGVPPSVQIGVQGADDHRRRGAVDRPRARLRIVK